MSQEKSKSKSHKNSKSRVKSSHSHNNHSHSRISNLFRSGGGSSNSQNNNSKSKISQELEEKINTNVLVSCFSKIFGDDCGDVVHFVYDLFQLVFQLYRKETFLKKVQRLSIIGFVFIMMCISGGMLTMTGVGKVVVNNKVLNATHYNTSINQEELIFQGMNVKTLNLLFYNNVVMLAGTIVLLLIVFIFEKLEFFVCLIITFLGYWYVDYVFFVMDMGFYGGVEISYGTAILVFGMFVYDTMFFKIFWIIVFFVNLVTLLIFDFFIFKARFKENALMFLNDSFEFNLIYGYCAMYIPVVLMISTYFVKQFSEITWFKKVTNVQKTQIEKFEELEDFDIILEEQKVEKTTYGDEDGPMAKININKSLFLINYEDVKIQATIGSGGSEATVYKAEWANRVVAFKVFKTKDIENQYIFDQFEKEIQLFSSLRHPNILEFYGASIRPPRVGIVMEYCSNGDLSAYFVKKKVGIIEKLRIFKEISSAFILLQEKNVIHRDLKLENVLLNENYTAKIMDFGLSRVTSQTGSNDHMTTNLGTSLYMAPEITNANYDGKVDVFSMAILMYICLTENFTPYGDRIHGNQIIVKVSVDPTFRPFLKEDDFPGIEWLVRLIKCCWEHEPLDRPNFKEILQILNDNSETDETIIYSKNEGKINVLNIESEQKQEEKAQNILEYYKQKCKELQKEVEKLNIKLKEKEL